MARRKRLNVNVEVNTFRNLGSIYLDQIDVGILSVSGPYARTDPFETSSMTCRSPAAVPTTELTNATVKSDYRGAGWLSVTGQSCPRVSKRERPTAHELLGRLRDDAQLNLSSTRA